MPADEIARLNAALEGHYEIERELGHGGMATVYLARDLRHSRVVAIKVLNRQLAQAVGGERFIREISMAAQLQHPHILTLIDSGAADGFLYYVMPFVDGESLRSKITRDGALPVSEATRLFREIVDALAHAHKHGMVHRDIKPDNVMISERHALVVDFGVAKAMGQAASEHNLTTMGMSLGTPAYMAPEQITAESDVDQRADLYAAGVVAYEMLAGKPPFDGNPQQVMSAHMVSPPEILSVRQPSVPAAISRIVMKCLEKQRTARYQTAEELLAELEALATPAGEFASGVTAGKSKSRSRMIAMVAAGVVVVSGATYLITSSGHGKRWVRSEAIPQIQRYRDAGANDSAFMIAMKAEKEAPGDSVLKTMWPLFSRKGVFRTEPAGAQVYRAMFNDTTRWELIGKTPTDTVRFPASTTRVRYVLAGYREVNRLAGAVPTSIVVLDKENSPNPEMVRVTGGALGGGLPGLDGLKPILLSDFLLDRHEITNRQYKMFVDAGGYSKPELWQHEFVKDGRRLAFNDAMALFTDKTGRPGPATWEAGDFPSGQGDLPVGGVSWYEAAAYANYAGKSLPSLYHWGRAATLGLAAFILPGSNFKGQGPVVGSTAGGMSGFGAFDMAGNVREWCYNEDGGNRYILGGGYSDAPYLFNDAFTQPSFDRSAINGIRLAKYLKDEPNLALAMQKVVRAYRDYAAERPVSDAEFKTFLTQYDYDRAPLDAKIDARDSSSAIMMKEKISFAAAYGTERVIAYLYLPKRGKPPYQTVVYFPGSNAIYAGPSSSENLEINRIDFLLKSGRAVMYPIYKGTYERADSLKSDYANETIFYRDHVVMWGKDLRRSIDYLETRPDLDTKKLAYFGISWGAMLGGIMPAIEPRIKAAVLYVAGLEMEPARPEADPVNFLPRVRVPVIMLNGKYDHFFPVETSQKPFFRLLGTPADQKRYVLYEGGHFVPRTQLIAESLSWLDKYLGPVQ